MSAALSQPLALDALLGQGAVPEPAWMQEERGRHYAAFASERPSAGRYSRLKLDWAALPPMAPGFKVKRLAEGVHAESLASVMRQNAGRFLTSFTTATSAWDRLVFAGWRDGLRLHWPKGSSGDGLTEIGISSPGGGLVLEPLLLDVAEGQEANLWMTWQGRNESAMHVSALRGRVADGARLRLFLLHEGGGVHHHLSSALTLGRDASVEVFCAWMGGDWTVARMAADLDGPGARLRETHVILASGRDHMALDSQVRLATHHTHCDVQVKAVAMDEGRAVFTGNLVMEAEAVQSQAYLADHTLLLSKGARADSLPGLEIKAADVQASHAASMGQVDEEQLLYLMSRGLDPAAARHLIVVGFLESLLERAPFPSVEDAVAPLLEAKVTA